MLVDHVFLGALAHPHSLAVWGKQLPIAIVMGILIAANVTYQIYVTVNTSPIAIPFVTYIARRILWLTLISRGFDKFYCIVTGDNNLISGKPSLFVQADDRSLIEIQHISW